MPLWISAEQEGIEVSGIPFFTLIQNFVTKILCSGRIFTVQVKTIEFICSVSPGCKVNKSFEI